MARTVNIKELEAKRRLIVKGALDLIMDKGYDGFSVNQVIAHCGISKGSFFHHFDSKNSLLEGIVEILSDPIKEAYETLFTTSEEAPRDLLIAMFNVTRDIKMAEEISIAAYMKVLYEDDNTVLFHKILEKNYQVLLPYFEEVIVRGSQSGDFEFDCPRGVARHFLRMVMKTNEQVGRMMYQRSEDMEAWQKLSEELEAFEMIARQLFGYDDKVTLYPSEFYNYINGIIR